jgi:ABC-type nitrate/sulfonate/bicarbonate transport system permease component
MEILFHAISSLQRVGIGIFFGAIFGIFLAALRSALPGRVRNLFVTAFLFEFLRFPPPIAWIPFVILLFGIGQIPTLIIVFLASFPLMMMNTYEGLEKIPRPIIRVANSLGVSPLVKIWKIYLPCIFPNLFTGLRQALGLGWMSIIAAEMIGGQEGLGYAIQLSRLNLEYREMAIQILVIGTIGYVFHASILLAERKLLPWLQWRKD